MDWSKCPAVDRDPERCGGDWCFAGTRLQVSALFGNLDSGASVQEFLEWFPDANEEQVHQIMAFVLDSLKTSAKQQPAVAA